MDFDNCVDSDGTTDGSLKISGTVTSGGTGSASISFDDYSEKTSDESSIVDGKMQSSISETETNLSWDYYVQSSLLNNQTVHTYTTTPITLTQADTYPSAGAWRIEGSENTYMIATVVANGIEVSANGGQAELITWSELE
jgi:hypothetical protein